MSKLYNKYCELKQKDFSKIYVLKSGIFYLLLADDAEQYGRKLGLKLTKLNDQINKCGFPINSYEKYKMMLDNLDCEYEIIGNEERKEFSLEIMEYLRQLDINSLTPLKALEILNELKEKVINE